MTVAFSPALLDRHDRPLPRYTSYPPTPRWGAADSKFYLDALADLAARPADSLGIYVHFPFCVARCFYCGCHAVGTPNTRVQDPYLDRVAAEVGLVSGALAAEREVSQMHWGGGTPNYLTTAQLERAVTIFRDRFSFASNAEVSIEADPRVTTPEQVALLRRLGFNRISFGVQDLDPAVQAAIGRVQPAALVREATWAARMSGFQGVNFDLVYGLPEQTRATFARTLAEVIEIGPDRIACFGYAHVPWARPNQRRISTASLPDPNERMELFRLAVEMLTGAGYRWLGMDHFARPDDALAVAVDAGRLRRGFMGYTTEVPRHQLGFGVSAIGEVAGRYIQNEPGLGAWQRRVDAGALPVVKGHRLTGDDQLRRDAIMRILCELQLPLDQMPAEAAAPEAWSDCVEEGLVTLDRGVLAVTPMGRYFLRSVCAVLDPALDAPGAAPRYSRAV